MTALYAALAVAGGATIATPVVVAGWHRLVDFHDAHTDRPSTQPIRPVRAITAAPAAPPVSPAAAIAAVPHREVVDEHLGVLRIAGREPARLFDTRRYQALIGGAR